MSGARERRANCDWFGCGFTNGLNCGWGVAGAGAGGGTGGRAGAVGGVFGRAGGFVGAGGFGGGLSVLSWKTNCDCESSEAVVAAVSVSALKVANGGDAAQVPIGRHNPQVARANRVSPRTRNIVNSLDSSAIRSSDPLIDKSIGRCR